MVFHNYMGIRKTLRAVSRMLDGRPGLWTLECSISRLRGHRRAPGAVNRMRDGRVGGRGRGCPRYSYNASSADPGLVEGTSCPGVCVYYCRTYYKAVRGGEGDREGHVRIHCGVGVTELSTIKQHTLSMRYDEPRHMWTSVPITHK